MRITKLENDQKPIQENWHIVLLDYVWNWHSFSPPIICSRRQKQHNQAATLLDVTELIIVANSGPCMKKNQVVIIKTHHRWENPSKI